MTAAEDVAAQRAWRPTDRTTAARPASPVVSEMRHRLTAAKTADLASHSVAINRLVHGDSLRSGGIDEAHVRRLNEVEGPLPPILVHRATLRIIDGFHRVYAARLRGANEIDVCFLDDSLDAAFVVAVESNVKHGLPLSLADRRRAASHILSTYPHWSDRVIATSAGLSTKTVASLRAADDAHSPPRHRLGRDGRVRPVSAASGRQLAAELIAANPAASLRDIAEQAGISPGTVRDVRVRLQRGDDPVPSREKAAPPAHKAPSSGSLQTNRPKAADVNAVLATLTRDPALRMNARGRELLRWLHSHAVSGVDGDRIRDLAPHHSIEHLIEFATRSAANWAYIAAYLAEYRGMPTAGEDIAGQGLVDEQCG